MILSQVFGAGLHATSNQDNILQLLVIIGTLISGLLVLSLLLLPRNLADWCCAALVLLSSGFIFALVMLPLPSARIAEMVPMSAEQIPRAIALAICGLVTESNTKHTALGFMAGMCYQTAAATMIFRIYAPLFIKNHGNLDNADISAGEWNNRQSLARNMTSANEIGAYSNLDGRLDGSNFPDQAI